MTRSNILEMVGNNDIGLLLFKQQLSPFLNKGFTLATFNASGKIPVSKDSSLIIVNGLEISYFIDLSSLLEISPLPEEFLLFKLLIIVNVSHSVILLKLKRCSVGLIR